eukprot:7998536-Lingulodinium_polyedra.AAC.1
MSSARKRDRCFALNWRPNASGGRLWSTAKEAGRPSESRAQLYSSSSRLTKAAAQSSKDSGVSRRRKGTPSPYQNSVKDAVQERPSNMDNGAP